MRLHEIRLSWLLILCFMACSLLLLLDQTSPMGHRAVHTPDVTPKTAPRVHNQTMPANSGGNLVFYFAVTHSANIHSKLEASLRTWCRRVYLHTGRKVIWYSNAPDPRVDHVISYNEKDETDTITYRMALIWRHVSENYPDFKWYARFWDDNYVIPSTLEALIPSSFDTDEPLEIGRLALANEGGRLAPVNSEALVINQAMLPYIDGGAGSLLSHGGMRRMVDGLDECFAWFRDTMSRQIPSWQRVEDLTFGTCAFNLFGTKFQRALGMYHGTHNVQNAAQHLCRHEPYAAEHESEVSVPRVFHFVSAEDMYFIDRQWYDCFHPDDDRCLSPALPEDQVHIVVAVHNFLASSVLEWVETLGFSRASVFLYYCEPQEIRTVFTGRCRIKVTVRASVEALACSSPPIPDVLIVLKPLNIDLEVVF